MSLPAAKGMVKFYDEDSGTLADVPAAQVPLMQEAGYKVGKEAENAYFASGTGGKIAAGLLGAVHGATLGADDLVMPTSVQQIAGAIKEAHPYIYGGSDLAASALVYHGAGSLAAGLGEGLLGQAAARVATSGVAGGIEAASIASQTDSPLTVERFAQGVGVGALFGVAGEGVGLALQKAVPAAQRQANKYLKSLVDKGAYVETAPKAVKAPFTQASSAAGPLPEGLRDIFPQEPALEFAHPNDVSPIGPDQMREVPPLLPSAERDAAAPKATELAPTAAKPLEPLPPEMQAQLDAQDPGLVAEAEGGAPTGDWGDDVDRRDRYADVQRARALGIDASMADHYGPRFDPKAGLAAEAPSGPRPPARRFVPELGIHGPATEAATLQHEVTQQRLSLEHAANNRDVYKQHAAMVQDLTDTHNENLLAHADDVKVLKARHEAALAEHKVAESQYFKELSAHNEALDGLATAKKQFPRELTDWEDERAVHQTKLRKFNKELREWRIEKDGLRPTGPEPLRPKPTLPEAPVAPTRPIKPDAPLLPDAPVMPEIPAPKLISLEEANAAKATVAGDPELDRLAADKLANRDIYKSKLKRPKADPNAYLNFPDRKRVYKKAGGGAGFLAGTEKTLRGIAGLGIAGHLLPGAIAAPALAVGTKAWMAAAGIRSANFAILGALNNQQRINALVQKFAMPAAKMTATVVRTLIGGELPAVAVNHFYGQDIDTTYRAVAETLPKLTADPQAVSNHYDEHIGPLFHDTPQFYSQFIATQNTALQYLADAIPKDPRPPSLIPTPYEPPRADKAKFLHVMQAVNSPLESLQNPTLQSVAAVAAVHPETLKLVKQQALSQLVGRTKPLNPTQAKQLSILLGAPVSPSLQANFIASMQQAVASQQTQQAQQQAMPKRGPGRPPKVTLARNFANSLAPGSQQNELENSQ